MTTLQDALREGDFTERRKMVRDLVTPFLETWSKGAIQVAFDDSPIVGDGVEQINPRATYTGLRDSLDVETMVGIIVGKIAPSQVLDAIRKPNHEGYATTSSKSKTGYIFGRPRTFDDKAYEECRLSAFTTTTEEEPMSEVSTNVEDYGLEELCNVHDDLVVNEGWTSEDAMQALHNIFGDHDRLKPMPALLDSRTDVPEPDHTSKSNALTKHILATQKKDEDSAVPIPTAPSADASALIDLALTQNGLPKIADMIDSMQKMSDDIVRLRKSSATIVAPTTSEVKGDGTIPSGKVKVAKAHALFGITGKGLDSFDFDVPCWEWDGDHPHVPEIDTNYVFRPMSLFRVLYALITNQPCYLHGHTGSGKTTLIEQVAARLRWPFSRVNFDSEITRMDLVGRDVLTKDGEATISKFVDGILPQMMASPTIGCFDELDFIRPDIAYVMQRAFEGNGLLLTEDGGRLVKPHAMFRMFATGNTVGQGDEFGMYQGARPQSMALLDRFKVWIHVEYMDAKQREELIKSSVPSLDKAMVNKVSKYVTEHINAFTTSKVMQPISPRGYIALANAIQTFTSLMPSGDNKLGVRQAIETVVLDRCSAQDRAVLNGIVDRIFN